MKPISVCSASSADLLVRVSDYNYLRTVIKGLGARFEDNVITFIHVERLFL